MTAEVIAIGSELTCGSRLDTNSRWLSQELEALGWSVTRHTTLSDQLDQLTAELRAAAARSQVILVTGGLGPTLDDITREALAAAFHQPLVMDEVSLHQIRAIFAARGREMAERNQRQALRPAEAAALPNRCGTAPGILLRVPAGSADAGQQTSRMALIAVLPGVPAEMKAMFDEQVRPQISDSGTVIRRTILRTFGYGESDAERLLGDLTARGRNPEVGITASEAVISLSITARSDTVEHGDALVASVRSDIRERLGTAVYTEGDQELHDVVAEQLLAAGRCVALREGTTTGGLLSCWLTEQTRFAPCLTSAVVSPSPTTQTAVAAVLDDWERLARHEADILLQAKAADFVLLSSPFAESVSPQGVALKQGSIALAGPGLFEVLDCSMSGNLAIFRQRAARTALNRLRLYLIRHSPLLAD